MTPDEEYAEASRETFDSFSQLVSDKHIGGFIIIGVESEGENFYCSSLTRQGFDTDALIYAISNVLQDVTGGEPMGSVERTIH